MILLCFDTDGTIETSKGPVTVSMMRGLEAAGYHVVIVSPSELRPDGFLAIDDGSARRDNLARARERFPSLVRLYISDNEDREDARTAGFLYVDRHEFAAMMASTPDVGNAVG